MPIGLIRLITTQKVLKTHSNKSVKQHCLGSNQIDTPRVKDPIDWLYIFPMVKAHESEGRHVVRL